MPPLAVPSSLVRTTPVTVDRLGEHPRLDDAVLAGGRVEHQQHLGHRRLLLDDPLDLARARPSGPTLVCSRPAVSTTTASTSPSTPVRTASKATDAGVGRPRGRAR
jgi:hypothetical protein